MKVKLRAVSKVGKAHGLFVTAVKVNENTYATGQGVIPGDKSTEGFLTLKEMTGETPLSSEKLAKFQYVVDPFKQYKFSDGHPFDLDTPEGKALRDLILISNNLVAKNKISFDRMTHHFYIEDLARENSIETKSFKLTIKAGIAIDKLSDNEVTELADYLYINKNISGCSRDRDREVVINTIYKYASTKPEIILDALKKENKISLYVSTLIIKGILTKKGTDFYEGKTFIASDFNQLISIYNTDLAKAARWDNKFRELSKNIHATFEEPSINIDEIRSNFLTAILEENKPEINNLIKVITNSKSNELLELVVKYKDKITDILEGQKPKVITTTGSEKYTVEDLLKSCKEEQFMTFKSKFVKTFSDYEGRYNKEDLINFLNKQ